MVTTAVADARDNNCSDSDKGLTSDARSIDCNDTGTESTADAHGADCNDSGAGSATDANVPDRSDCGTGSTTDQSVGVPDKPDDDVRMSALVPDIKSIAFDCNNSLRDPLSDWVMVEPLKTASPMAQHPSKLPKPMVTTVESTPIKAAAASFSFFWRTFMA